MARRWRGTVLRPTCPQTHTSPAHHHGAQITPFLGQPLAHPSSVPSERSAQRRASLPEQGFHKHTICRLLSPGPQLKAGRSPLGRGVRARLSSGAPASLLQTVPASPGHSQDALLKVSWQRTEQSQKTQRVRPDSSRAVGSCVLLTGPCNRPQVTQHEENRQGYAGSPSTKPVVLWWGTSAVQGLLDHLGRWYG